jgi:hypothetical protein
MPCPGDVRNRNLRANLKMNSEAWLEDTIKATIEHDLEIENAIEYIRQLAVYSGHPAKPHYFLEAEIRKAKCRLKKVIPKKQSVKI